MTVPSADCESSAGEARAPHGTVLPSTPQKKGPIDRDAAGGANGVTREARFERVTEVLEDASRRLEQRGTWYETLGLPCDKLGKTSGVDASVDDVLAYNIACDRIRAAHETVLAPSFVVFDRLLCASREAHAPRDEVLELVQYCVGICTSLLEAARAEEMTYAVVQTFSKFRQEMEEVGSFFQTYGTQKSCCGWQATRGYRQRNKSFVLQKTELHALLNCAVSSLEAESDRSGKELMHMLNATSVKPAASDVASVPLAAPEPPEGYVERLAVVERVVLDLVDPDRRPSAAHCLVGRGGAGKSVLASAVLRDRRVRSMFTDGIFWVPVGSGGKANVTLLLERLLRDVAAALPLGRSMPKRPYRFDGVQEAERYTAKVRDREDLRCLVVLDGVWDVEVVNAFASTGFHMLVTTRTRSHSPPAFTGLCTEVGKITHGEGLELLQKASGATGPLPEEEACQVAVQCDMLPLALSIAGALAKQRPLAPDTWRRVNDQVQERHILKFLDEDQGHLFSAVDASFEHLSKAQKGQFQLMAVLSKGAVASTEMLASLWAMEPADVQASAGVLVSNYLLQAAHDGYHLHDLVLEYLELFIKTDGDLLGKVAASRLTRFLARPSVLHQYSCDNGLHRLADLWNAAARMGDEADVGHCYLASLEEDHTAGINIGPWLEAARLLEHMGQPHGAEAMLKEALSISEGQRADLDERATALNDLGIVLESQGNLDEANLAYQRAIELGTETLGPDHPSLARMLNDRAGLLRAQGKYAEATPLYLRAIELGGRARGLDKADFVALMNKAATLDDRKDHDGAENLFRRAIEKGEETLGLDHSDLAIRHYNLAELLRLQGDLIKAERHYARAQDIREETLGAEQPAVAIVLNNRADLLRMQGDFVNAETLTARAQTILEHSVGPEHPSVAITVTNRAGLLEAQGKYSKAEPLHVRATKIWEKTHGPDHPLVATALNNTGGLLRHLGRFAEADRLYIRATGIWQEAYGPEHPLIATAMNNRAALMKAQGKYAEADRLYLRSIQIGEKTLGPDHPSVATRLGNRARLLATQGNENEAVALLERALTIRGRALGEEHKDTVNCRRALESIRSQQMAASE